MIAESVKPTIGERVHLEERCGGKGTDWILGVLHIPLRVRIRPRDLDGLIVCESWGINGNKQVHTCPISAKRSDSLMFVADLSYRDRNRVGFVCVTIE